MAVVVAVAAVGRGKLKNVRLDNIQDNVYGAVIMAEPLREFARFI